MRFSLDWLREYVDLPETAAEVAAVLTSLGLAVEGSETVGADTVFEVEVTTNRPDAMCHVGIARELAVKLGRPLRMPQIVEESTGASGSGVAIEIEHLNECAWYTARVVRGVRVGPSPAWMMRRLEAIGLRSINNVVDVTNYVMWETGQPLHAFDLDLLAGRSDTDAVVRVLVRRARTDETLAMLDGSERKLDPEMLVIADAEQPVALAGVMGGRQSAVDAADQLGAGELHALLIESAHFDRRRVREAARRGSLHTDASHRFERGTDPAACAWASARAAYLIREFSPGAEVSPISEGGAAGDSLHWGVVEHARLERFAGFEIAAGEIERIFVGLGFTVHSLGGDRWRLTPPTWRIFDFEPKPAALWSDDGGQLEEADLFEEVLRQVGLDGVPSLLPAMAGADEGRQDAYDRRHRLRQHLAAAGLAETIHFAFYAAPADAVFAPLLGGEPLRLANPISENYAFMRRSLLPNLLESVRFNLRRGASAVRLFESGNVFSTTAELEAVGLAIGGRFGTPWEGARELGFFELKGLLESSLEGGAELRFRSASLAGFVAGTGSEILDAEGRRVGVLGVVDDADLAVPVAMGEILMAALTGDEPRAIAVPSRFPGIAVDTTILHADAVRWRDLAAAIGEARVDNLTAFGLKDRYRGEGVPAGTVKSTLWFDYQATDRSLTQEEVNARHFGLVSELERRFGYREGAG
jgi:phenylalanyl-tRNA synthetase beta chain